MPATPLYLAPSWRVRPTRPEDVSRLYELECCPDSCRMAGVKPRSREAFFARWDDIFKDANITRHVVEMDTPLGPKIVGTINIFQRDGKSFVGYLITKEHWGKGLASFALAEILKHDLRRPLFANASTSNAASVRVLQKHGFRLLGFRFEGETDRYTAGEIAEFVLDPPPIRLDHAIAILERTPRVLDTLLRGLPTTWTHHNYGPGTWCAYEVVGHFIINEQLDWLPRLRRILEHGESRPFDPFPHDATIRPESGRSLESLLDEFATLRAQSLHDLRSLNLTPADLERTGTHPAFGRVTASQLLATWAVHDLHHLRQISLAMAWQYREAVGPWRAYLNTLAR